MFFQDFYSRYPRTGKIPFTNLGMAYISFAREEKKLFELLFLSDLKKRKSMYEVMNGSAGNVVYEINMAGAQGCKNPSVIFMKMWIFIHGAACMSLTGDYDLNDEETMDLLEKTYSDYVRSV